MEQRPTGLAFHDRRKGLVKILESKSNDKVINIILKNKAPFSKNVSRSSDGTEQTKPFCRQQDDASARSYAVKASLRT